MVAETTCQRTPTMPDTIAKLATLNMDGQDMGMQTFFESVEFNHLINQYEMSRDLQLVRWELVSHPGNRCIRGYTNATCDINAMARFQQPSTVGSLIRSCGP